MSSVFDTISRFKLIEILETIIEEDELKIVRFMLSNTKLTPRINHATEQEHVMSYVGTLQGYCLSPVLFTTYLGKALRELRKETKDSDKLRPSEIAYADAVDFISAKQHRNVSQMKKLR